MAVVAVVQYYCFVPSCVAEKGESSLRSLSISYVSVCEWLAHGLRQLMNGSRKFALEHVTCNDIAALTPEAASVSGIPLV